VGVPKCAEPGQGMLGRRHSQPKEQVSSEEEEEEEEEEGSGGVWEDSGDSEASGIWGHTPSRARPTHVRRSLSHMDRRVRLPSQVHYGTTQRLQAFDSRAGVECHLQHGATQGIRAFDNSTGFESPSQHGPTQGFQPTNSRAGVECQLQHEATKGFQAPDSTSGAARQLQSGITQGFHALESRAGASQVQHGPTQGFHAPDSRARAASQPQHGPIQGFHALESRAGASQVQSGSTHVMTDTSQAPSLARPMLPLPPGGPQVHLASMSHQTAWTQAVGGRGKGVGDGEGEAHSGRCKAEGAWGRGRTMSVQWLRSFEIDEAILTRPYRVGSWVERPSTPASGTQGTPSLDRACGAAPPTASPLRLQANWRSPSPSPSPSHSGPGAHVYWQEHQQEHHHQQQQQHAEQQQEEQKQKVPLPEHLRPTGPDDVNPNVIQPTSPNLTFTQPNPTPTQPHPTQPHPTQPYPTQFQPPLQLRGQLRKQRQRSHSVDDLQETETAVGLLRAVPAHRPRWLSTCTQPPKEGARKLPQRGAGRGSAGGDSEQRRGEQWFGCEWDQWDFPGR